MCKQNIENYKANRATVSGLHCKNIVYESNFFIVLALYPKGCNESESPYSCHCASATQLLSKKCCSNDKPLETLCPVWSVRDLNPDLPFQR